MNAIASVYATFPDLDEAERIGRVLVEERLAACVNILGPCRSIYRWQGAIEQAEEVAAIFKTTSKSAPILVQRLSELHSYDVPAAVIWPIDGSIPAYAEWVISETELVTQPERYFSTTRETRGFLDLLRVRVHLAGSSAAPLGRRRLFQKRSGP